MGDAAPAVFGPGIRYLQPPSACFAIRHQLPSCLKALGNGGYGRWVAGNKAKKKADRNDRPESF
jgi:hypothetical protein